MEESESGSVEFGVHIQSVTGRVDRGLVASLPVDELSIVSQLQKFTGKRLLEFGYEECMPYMLQDSCRFK